MRGRPALIYQTRDGRLEVSERRDSTYQIESVQIEQANLMSEYTVLQESLHESDDLRQV